MSARKLDVPRLHESPPICSKADLCLAHEPDSHPVSKHRLRSWMSARKREDPWLHELFGQIQERPLQSKSSSKGTKDPTDLLESRPLSGSQTVTATRCRNTAFAHGHLLESKMFRGFIICRTDTNKCEESQTQRGQEANTAVAHYPKDG